MIIKKRRKWGKPPLFPENKGGPVIKPGPELPTLPKIPVGDGKKPVQIGKNYTCFIH